MISESISHLYILFGEILTQVLTLLFSLIIRCFAIELCELLTYLWNWPHIRCTVLSFFLPFCKLFIYPVQFPLLREDFKSDTVMERKCMCLFVGFGEVGEINFLTLSMSLIPENTPSELSLRVPQKQTQQKCQDAKTQTPSLLWYHMGSELPGNLPLSQASSFLTPLWHANVIIFYVYLL